MVKKYTLHKRERLKSRKLIEQLFRQGKSFSVAPYKVIYLLSGNQAAGSPSLLFGVGVSTRNFKRAVDRNRVKRLTREAYRLQKLTLAQQLAEQNRQLAVFFIYTGRELPDYATVAGKLSLILKKLERVIDTENRTAS